jgi:hypothetical protein
MVPTMSWVLMPGNQGFINHFSLITNMRYSIWLCQCCAVFRYSHHNAGENPEMRTLFYCLSHLLRLHVRVIFVFDRTKRAETKRGKKVKMSPHWLETAFVEMLGLFRFGVHKVNITCSVRL